MILKTTYFHLQVIHDCCFPLNSKASSQKLVAQLHCAVDFWKTEYNFRCTFKIMMPSMMPRLNLVVMKVSQRIPMLQAMLHLLPYIKALLDQIQCTSVYFLYRDWYFEKCCKNVASRDKIL